MIIKREEHDRYSLRLSVVSDALYRHFTVVAEDKQNLTVFIAYKKVVFRRYFTNQRLTLKECCSVFNGMNKLLSGVAA